MDCLGGNMRGKVIMYARGDLLHRVVIKLNHLSSTWVEQGYTELEHNVYRGQGLFYIEENG